MLGHWVPSVSEARHTQRAENTVKGADTGRFGRSLMIMMLMQWDRRAGMLGNYSGRVVEMSNVCSIVGAITGS